MIARLIGLMGESGSGKNYAAKYIKTKDEYKFDSRALADPIRSYLEVINPEIISYVTLKDLLKYNTWDGLKHSNFIFPFFSLTQVQRDDIVVKIRKLVQLHGEAARAVFGEDHWIKLCFPNIGHSWASHAYYTHCNPNLLITDVRMPIEAKAIQDLGGYVIKVVRPGQAKYEEWRQHYTETQINANPYDAILINDERLFERCDELLKAIDFALKDNKNIHVDYFQRGILNYE